VLSGDEIRRAAIVQLDHHSAEVQIQPNGVDLSLEALFTWHAAGALGRSNADRLLPPRVEVAFDADGWADLASGTYGVRYAESVSIPGDRGGLCFPRSSLLRMGVHVPTAVWDAGYRGRGEGLIVVTNPYGVRLQRGARIAQLVIFELTEPPAQTYSGAYQEEGAPNPLVPGPIAQ
jgi:dUTP pyrophosphatase